MPSLGLLAAVDDANVIGLLPHPAQRELLALIESHRLVVAACGRRFGKTKAAAAAAIWNLLLTPELDGMVGQGERRFAVCVANSQTQARIFLEHAAALVKASPTLAGELVSESARELEFRGGRTLAAFPASARSGRGWAISFLCLDELAHALDVEEGGPQTQERIWASMTPSVAQFGGLGRIVVTSTPLGSAGLFAELYAKAKGGEIEGAASFHAPTSANPAIDAAYLAGQEATLGTDDFQREFEAAFTGGGGSFFEESRVRDVVADWRELLPSDVLQPVAAFDPAFSSDPAALAIVGRDPADPGRLLVAWSGRWLPPRRKLRSYRTRSEQETVMAGILDEVAEIALRYRARVVSDQHLPGTVLDELRQRGVSASIRAWSARSRDEALGALRARIYTERITLPDDPQLVTELCRLRTRFRAGSSTVEVPKVGDSHCDVALAVALGVLEHERSFGQPARVGRARDVVAADPVRTWNIYRENASVVAS